MMRTTKLLMWATLAVGLVSTAQAQDYPPPPDRPRHKADNPAGVFWPSEKLVDLAINRIVDRMAEVYQFDDAQSLDTRDVIKGRFPDWLKSNRGELQSLMLQYFEVVLGDEPPTPEEVADWAERAQPIIEEFSTLVNETTDDMRTYMTDEQQVLLDGQWAAMQVGMNYMQQRLATWRDGGYDWESDWPRSDKFKETEKQRREDLHREAERERSRATGRPEPAADAAGGGGAVDPGAAGGVPGTKAASPARPTGSKDEWTVYVDNFIQRYKLDEAQQNNAYKALRNQQELRDRQLQRNADNIKTLEKKQQNAKTDEEKSQVRAEYERINRPIERYFQQLKDKLETLPTRKQRAAAAQAEEATKSQASEEKKSAIKAEIESRVTTKKAEKPAEEPKPAEGGANK